MHGYGVNVGVIKMVVIKSVQEKIDVLKHEVDVLKNIYNSMDHNGGRFNTAASVLEERIEQLEFDESFRR